MDENLFKKGKVIKDHICLCSIGGDENLTTVTTLPSESLFGAFALLQATHLLSIMHIATQKVGFNLCFFVMTDILRHFNPNLMGYSNGTGKQDSPQAFLNQAVVGAKAK